MTAAQQPPRTIPRVMVIGVGNAYRSDDAVGQVVAQRLREEHQTGSLTPSLARERGISENCMPLSHT